MSVEPMPVPGSHRAEPELPEPERRPLSWTQISQYADCGRAYELKYRDAVPQMPKGALIGGGAIHTAIEAAYREGWWHEEITPASNLWIFYLEEFTRRCEDAEGGPEAIVWGGRKDAAGVPGEGFEWWTGHPPPRC